MVSASEFKSEDPGFDPLAVQDEKVFLSFRDNSCTDLFVPDHHFVCTAHTQICAHFKDPVSICHKRVGLTAGGMVTQKYCTH